MKQNIPEDIYLDSLKDKAYIGTDADGKIIEASPVDLSGYVTLDQMIPQSFANGIPMLSSEHEEFYLDHQIVDKEYVDWDI